MDSCGANFLCELSVCASFCPRSNVNKTYSTSLSNVSCSMHSSGPVVINKLLCFRRMNPFFVSKLWNLEKVFVSKAVFSRLHKFKIRDKIGNVIGDLLEIALHSCNSIERV